MSTVTEITGLGSYPKALSKLQQHTSRQPEWVRSLRHGVFHERIIVCKDAQKTDAEQTNRNLLLSDEAQIDTKPQLEIYADDVKCTHGATIGQIDENALYYLRSRGIDENSAHGLLLFAFAGIHKLREVFA